MSRRVLASLAAVLFAVLVLAVAARPAAAQDDSDCLECHQEKDLRARRAGAERPVFVDAKRLAASVHAKVACTSCHQDLDGAERFPHADKLNPVDCAECHDKEAALHAESLHGKAHAKGDPMAPTCAECHGSHDVLRAKDPQSPVSHMRIPHLCGKCHHEGSPVSRTHDIPQDRILENYSEGMHGEGLFKKGLAVTAVCTSCHTPHEIRSHEDPKSSIHRENVVKTCMQCHVEIERVHRKVIDGKLWEEEPHKVPVCVDCHQPHKVRKVFYPAGAANRDCLTCHGKPGLSMQKDGRTIDLFVDEAAYAGSTHQGVGCAQCHADVDPSRDDRACATVKRKVDCSACHADQVNQYRTSTHGTLHAQGDRDAPACLDCHDDHATQSKKSPASPTYPRNVPALCAKCHDEGERAARRIHSETPDIVGAYLKSVHGEGLAAGGLIVSATCVSCHTAHGQLPPKDANSTVHPSNLAGTCGQCHVGVAEELRKSVHGTPRPGSVRRLPTCESCHSSHSIARTTGDFRVNVTAQCGGCHAEQGASYFESIHGKATQLGGAGAAKCQDCHGRHDILPVADPASRMSPPNRTATCAKCHDDAHPGFASYLAHADPHDPRSGALHWVYRGMTALLVGTMVVASLHSALWLFRLWRTRSEWQPHVAAVRAAAARGEAKFYKRFSATQSAMHAVMVVSFLTLSLTGMALKFSWTPWGHAISDFFGGFERMGMLHRTGAVLLLALFTFHVWDVLRMRKERGWTWKQLLFGEDSMMFGRRDGQEFLGTLRWFLGRGPRPAYGRFTYWEKFDYFAVFWGVAVIGLSGLVLWFPALATRALPGWAINVALVVHGDEALLAVAFIFTIHFFNTQFRPDKFPMDVSVFTGAVPIEELRHERPREYAEAEASGALAARTVEAPTRHLEHGVKLLGGAALLVGIALVLSIGYALLLEGRP